MPGAAPAQGCIPPNWPRLTPQRQAASRPSFPPPPAPLTRPKRRRATSRCPLPPLPPASPRAPRICSISDRTPPVRRRRRPVSSRPPRASCSRPVGGAMDKNLVSRRAALFDFRFSIPNVQTIVFVRTWEKIQQSNSVRSRQVCRLPIIFTTSASLGGMQGNTQAKVTTPGSDASRGRNRALRPRASADAPRAPLCTAEAKGTKDTQKRGRCTYSGAWSFPGIAVAG